MDTKTSTTPPGASRPAYLRRPSAALGRGVALTTVGAMALTGLVMAGSGIAQAAVPTFPDNIVVFPERDFVTVEGYQDHIGETALMEVTRPGIGVVGSARAVVAEGDVAFEVNHPGGACWGAGTGLAVTPDIQGGDIVSIKFDGTSAGETTVAGSHVSNLSPSGTRVVITGTLEGSNPAQIEQRIINPDLGDTEIGRRDVRALPGPLVTSDKGGYQSGMEVTDSTFTATYEFETANAADLAAAGGARIMSWQEEDVDANRQGLTISEFGENGGPGMGGCPNGPLQAGPVAPTDITATKISGGYRLNWTPAVAIAGTPAITGYQIQAIDKTVTGANAERAVVGKHIGTRTASRTDLIGLDPTADYDIEIVSVSSVGLTFPPANVHPVEDTTAPTITADPPAGGYREAQSVRLSSDEANTDIYYTLDGTDPYAGATLALEAIPYTGTIAVTQDLTLNYVAFDVVGNTSSGSLDYTISIDPAPAAPVVSTVTPGTESVFVDWEPVDTATGYVVQLFREGQPVENPVTTAGDVTEATVTGLQAGATYTATVAARNAGGTGEATPVAEFTIPVVVKAVAGPDVAAKRGTTVTLDGSGSMPNGGGTTYQWEQIDGWAANAVTLTNPTGPVTSFNFPFLKWTSTKPMTNAALRFRLTVTDDGISQTDEVVVSAINDRVTGTARWKTGDLRINGTATTIGSTVDIFRFTNGTRGALIGTYPVTAAVAPATGGVYTSRIRNAPANPNPGQVLVESSMGGRVVITVILG